MTPAEQPQTLTGDPREGPEWERPPRDPLGLLRQWLAAAQETVREPRALALATCDAGANPSSRMVLIRELDSRGIVFATALASRKADDMDAVGRAAGTLYWRETLQQVNVAGSVERLDRARSAQLFARRTRQAQASAVVSRQGAPLDDPERLRRDAAALAGGVEEIEPPAHWGGFRIVPDRLEFWLGSPDRLHRRLSYSHLDGRWAWLRLQP